MHLSILDIFNYKFFSSISSAYVYAYINVSVPTINLKIIPNDSNYERNLELSSNRVVGVWQGIALDLGLLALSKYMSYKFEFTFELNTTVHLASFACTLQDDFVYPESF